MKRFTRIAFLGIIVMGLSGAGFLIYNRYINGSFVAVSGYYNSGLFSLISCGLVALYWYTIYVLVNIWDITNFSIVAFIYRETLGQIMSSTRCLMFAIALYLALYYVHVSSIEICFTIALFSIALLIPSKALVLDYRIKHGLYGTCDAEAREIIYFMIEQKSKNGTGSPPKKLVFRQEELDEIFAADSVGGEKYAG